MDILLIGYGKMGKAIERIALSRGHRISGTIGSGNASSLPALLAGADVAIEFSRPAVAAHNIEACLKAGVPVVTGTTGWYEDYPRLAEICKENGGAILAATNFSIGVNIFFQLNKWLAATMHKLDSYAPSIEEIHHTEKLDAPSGTAITLAEGILASYPELNGWEGGIDTAPAVPDKLPVISKRLDKVPGTHTVSYRSAIDDIEIKHTAHNRDGFATGAVIAAEFLHDKAGIFTMNDVLKL